MGEWHDRKIAFGISALGAIAWLVILPLAFVTLYTALELQTSARAATKGDVRLATIKVVDMARQLDERDSQHIRRSTLTFERLLAMQESFRARAEAKAAIIDYLSRKGVAKAPDLCTAPPEELKKCQIDYDMSFCTGDWLKTVNCYARATELRVRSGTEGDGFASLPPLMSEARKKGFAFNLTSIRVRESNELEKDPLLPVVESYRLVGLPFFRPLFALPQGVIIACFTAVMACIGAAVSVLLALIRGADRDNDAWNIARRAALAPLVGGVAGFMVYFVIAAGAAFMVQPANGGAVEAVNSLSPPALASLGLFAGLAADKAIAWLRAKAGAFFKV